MISSILVGVFVGFLLGTLFGLFISECYRIEQEEDSGWVEKDEDFLKELDEADWEILNNEHKESF